MPKYAIVRKAKSVSGCEYLIFRDGNRVGNPEENRDAAVLAVFDLSGWTGDCTIRFCDDEEIYKAGL
jgi:hypothetical protein